MREGRDRMRALMLARLPADLRGARVLDAGCGTGLMTAELAARGAEVVAVDISPALVEIARERLPATLRRRSRFARGRHDWTRPLGRFDHVMAMDSLIYYRADDIGGGAAPAGRRTARRVGASPSRRARRFLMAFWRVGQAVSARRPVARDDPAMPRRRALHRAARGRALAEVGRVSRGLLHLAVPWRIAA
ncbi:MAG: methyltransferase domain-containing protein [Desulfobacterales bacterium]|nr:methyltransferase domain-containing protein [Desulfobacterales bacterium]